MTAVAYLIPVAACLLLHLEFGYEGKWTTYLWIMIFGEGTVGILHWLFYEVHTSKTEYLGSLVSDIVHEEEWTELVERTETRKDSRGNTYTVTRIEEKWHPEKYYFHTTRGSEIKTDFQFYAYVRRVWGLGRHELSWTGGHIKGGARFGSMYQMADFDYSERENPGNWVPVTEAGSYTNKVQASNSIFKFEKIEAEDARAMGLYDYPPICQHDAACVLSNEIAVPDGVDDLFRKFNGRYAPQAQMRLYVMLFDSSRGVSVSEMQRAYWQGGNKNEFSICIGMNRDSEVEWARAFSWADEQTKEVETAQWLMQHRNLDWQAFHDWFAYHIVDWNRKEFKDFDYIHITLPMWQILTIIIISIAENALALYMAI